VDSGSYLVQDVPEKREQCWIMGLEKPFPQRRSRVPLTKGLSKSSAAMEVRRF
jgi:hypothetical protein